MSVYIQPEIIIDGITFKLLNKYEDDNDYLIVNLISNNTDSFSCYRSNSELGMWRLCSRTDDPTGKSGQLYKGHELTNYDYVQTTLIHIILQIFINLNINDRNLYNGYISSSMYANCKINPANKIIINDPDRLQLIAPFNSEIQCGQTLHFDQSYEKILQEQSKLISEQFTYDEFIEISPYEYIFQEIIHVTGIICQVTLINKEDNSSRYYLSFLLCKLCKLTSTDLDDICNLDLHIMPISLIPINSHINEIGLYSAYVNAGAYICKFVDYHIQCTRDELRNNLCYLAYTYIGKRYLTIWPYINLINNGELTVTLAKINISYNVELEKIRQAEETEHRRDILKILARQRARELEKQQADESFLKKQNLRNLLKKTVNKVIAINRFKHTTIDRQSTIDRTTSFDLKSYINSAYNYISHIFTRSQSQSRGININTTNTKKRYKKKKTRRKRKVKTPMNKNDLNINQLSLYNGSKYNSKRNFSSKRSKTRIPSSTNKLS